MHKSVRGFIAVFTLLTLSGLIAQDISGSYKLSGLNVVYYNIARETTPIVVSDIYGIGITTPISVINEGDVFYATYNGPHSEEALTLSGVNLNVNFFEDGTGETVEGSFYPDVTEVNCVSQVHVLPILDDIVYSSDLNNGNVVQPTNIIGLPNASTYVGQTVGGIALSQSVIFDYFPDVHTVATLPSPINIDVNGDGTPDVILPANEPLPGFTVGYAAKGNLTSLSPENAAIGNHPDLYLEWHAIDGEMSEAGLGEIVGVDEDGDGTDFDRIFGLPFVQATIMSAACGFNYPIVGDVSAIFEAQGLGFCVEEVDVANDFYLMDAQFSTWGNFLTYNAVVFSATLEGLIGQGLSYDDALAYIIANQPELLGDDSDHDFDGASGRLVMHFDPTCIPEYETQSIFAEFRELDCDHSGNANGDDNLDVLDIVIVIDHILGADVLDAEGICNGDVDNSGEIDILDVVIIVDYILNPPGRMIDATSAMLIEDGNTVSLSSDGFVGGIQMTLKHGADFKMEFSEGAYMADSYSLGDETRIVIVHPGEELFKFEGDYSIQDIIVASGSNYIDVTLTESIGLISSYPNPFNPETRIDFNLTDDGPVTLEVFDMLGKKIKTLTNEYKSKGNYSETWNGTNVDNTPSPSGVYLVKLSGGNKISTQKITLLK